MTQSFGYNPAGQITTRGLSNDNFAFTNRVNVNRNYATNGLNQYTSAGPANFAYDANGNLTSDGSVTYSYDTENRLVGASGAKTASLLYDPLGRLVRTHNGNTANARWFVYDGNEMVAEYDGSGNMLKRYLHGPGVDEPLAWFDGPTTNPANRHDMFADHQGSIVAVTSNTGATESLNRYDEFGIPGPGQTSRFQYTGQAWLPELGVYYYKARIYSPTLGRFMQTDPIGYSDGPNWYNYVGSDPVNRTDPTGLLNVCLKTGGSPGTALNDYTVTLLYICQEIDFSDRSGERGNESGGGSGAERNSSASAGAQQNNSRIKPSTRKYLCRKLGANGFNVPKTFSDVLKDRHSDGRRNWSVPEFRQSENFLYATGQWRSPPTDGSTYLGVYAWQFSKYVRSSTSDFSWDALDAGLDGVDHKNDTPADLKAFCNAN